eukprot:jgi/Ulvmu1/10491/UM064_0028.1
MGGLILNSIPVDRWTATEQSTRSLKGLGPRTNKLSLSRSRQWRLRRNVQTCTSSAAHEAVIRKIRGCAVLYGEVVPLYGPAGLYLDCLKLIQQLRTASQRDELLKLPASGIRRLWKLSQGYFDASEQDVLVAAGQWTTVDDFSSPKSPRGDDLLVAKSQPTPKESRTYKYRRASVAPWGPPLVRVSTVQFSPHENGDLVGRIDCGLGAPGRLIYPRYFQCQIEPGLLVPATSEQAALLLRGCDSSQVCPLALQGQHRWPAPRRTLWPHAEQWAEYLRPLAPGVYSSCTWVNPCDVSKAKCVAQSLLVKHDP